MQFYKLDTNRQITDNRTTVGIFVQAKPIASEMSF